MRNGSVVFLKIAPIAASVVTALVLAAIVLLALNGMGGFSATSVRRVNPVRTVTPESHVVAVLPTDPTTVSAVSAVDTRAARHLTDGQVLATASVPTAADPLSATVVMSGSDLGTELDTPGVTPSVVAPAAETLEPGMRREMPVSNRTPAMQSTLASQSTLAPVGVGAPRAPEPESVLLLYDSANPKAFDFNFCRIAEYYGVGCKRISADGRPLADAELRMADGSYYKLVGLSPALLAGEESRLYAEALDILQTAVVSGMNLLVPVQEPGAVATPLAQLTDGAILDVTAPDNLVRNWSVADAEPAITRSFTGQRITCTDPVAPPAEDLSFSVKPAAVSTPLLSVIDDNGVLHDVVLQIRLGSGSIFVDGGKKYNSFPSQPLNIALDTCVLSEFIPTMWITRWALGDSAWHSDRQFANLTIDDPALTEPFNKLNFAALLRESKLHNFHTTIAFIPANLHKSEPSVVQLLLDNPDRYSLVQHGNNHDGYEFFKYEVSANDIYTSTYEKEGKLYPARPLADQEADILEGLSRMEEHQRITGVPFDKVMVFPYGISPEQTLAVLKQNNYLATVNATDVPLDAKRSSRWDFRMLPANLDYGNFPTLLRREAGAYEPFRYDLQRFVYDLFFGKPALFFSHTGHLFASGIDTFNPVADDINRFPGQVEWHSLGYIMKRLYLKRTNIDGSVDVKMFTNDLIVTPQQPGHNVYHITKEETLNVPISALTVNGQDFPYRIEKGALNLDVIGPEDGSPFEVKIHYGAATDDSP